MKFLLFLLLPAFGYAQCKTINAVYSLSTGYQNGFTISMEGGFWQVTRPFQASIGVMAYNVEKAGTLNGKTEIYKEPTWDPFLRVGMKLTKESPVIIVASGFASWRGVVGLTCRSFYQIGPKTLAGIQFGESNKGVIAKTDFVFSF